MPDEDLAESSSASAEGDRAAETESTPAPSSHFADVDIAAEVGVRSPTDAYIHDEEALAEQPPADESVVAVLCNLNSEYIGGLASARADGGLDSSFVALSLGDYIQVWEMLVNEYPGAEDDVNRAKSILNDWSVAMAYEESGQVTEADKLYREIDAQIALLPARGEVSEVGC